MWESLLVGCAVNILRNNEDPLLVDDHVALVVKHSDNAFEYYLLRSPR